MSPDEAEDMAVRIIRTWPKMNIPPGEWEDALRPLDAGTVGTAFVRLRDNSKYPPTIAEFMDAYRALGRTGPGGPRTDCDACGGDGFNTRLQLIHSVIYEVQVACRCGAGMGAAEALANIRAFNQEQFDRVFANTNPSDQPAPYLRDHRKGNEFTPARTTNGVSCES